VFFGFSRKKMRFTNTLYDEKSKIDMYIGFHPIKIFVKLSQDNYLYWTYNICIIRNSLQDLPNDVPLPANPPHVSFLHLSCILPFQLYSDPNSADKPRQASPPRAQNQHLRHGRMGEGGRL